MKRIVSAIFVVLLSGCSGSNILRTQNEFCRILYADLPANFEKAIAQELKKEPPNGALTKEYSRDLWNECGNNRIFHVWSIGPDSCEGTYRGPAGRILIWEALAAREKAGLPPVEIEERNLGKEL